MFQTDCEIVLNKKISDNHFLISFDNSKIAGSAKPGQFVMIRVSDKKVFLRRPLSICGTGKKTFDVVFKVVGRGTEILSRQKKGDVLNVIGPLGNGYDTSAVNSKTLPLLIAGGTGIASLLFFAQNIKEHPAVFIGAKTKSGILLENNIKSLGCKVVTATEDGSHGQKGLITDVFSTYVSAVHYSQKPVIFACGPKGMLRKVAKMCRNKKLKCYLSLEEHMACGIGACMGCVVKIKNGNRFEYKKVCEDGPIFDAQGIIW